MTVAEAIQLVFTAIGLSVVALFTIRGIGVTIDEMMDRKEHKSEQDVIDKHFMSIVKD